MDDTVGPLDAYKTPDIYSGRLGGGLTKSGEVPAARLTDSGGAVGGGGDAASAQLASALKLLAPGLQVRAEWL
jgi:hypothetical protein